ncbi:MAG: hypothetical protein JW941_00885 [Candidatus Coatesbacteria bacterium]|nr:hypothetical protein [Candidatus Coatesbacteria bacterium]
MKNRILAQLELNLAKMEQGLATIERHAEMGDPIAQKLIAPLAEEIVRLKDACRVQLEHVIKNSDDPEIIDVATEALWQFMMDADHTTAEMKH